MDRHRITAGYPAVFALWMLMATCMAPSAFAQAPGGHEMCGDGNTFTVELPGTVQVILGAVEIDAPDSVTLPKGCRIYAFLIGDGGGDADQNAAFNQLTYYKFAKFLAENDGYVHYSWWNNLLKPYMGEPLHTFGLPDGVCLPSHTLLGFAIPGICGPLLVQSHPGTPHEFYSLDPIGIARDFGSALTPRFGEFGQFSQGSSYRSSGDTR
jgi:hypothetical protein